MAVDDRGLEGPLERLISILYFTQYAKQLLLSLSKLVSLKVLLLTSLGMRSRR